MTTTKTQAFNNKIKSLKEYHARLDSSVGIPSSNDIQTVLKYFCTTLKGILKETANIKTESYGVRNKDLTRIGLFPAFHYADLYYLVIGLCENVSKLSNQTGVCESILKTFHVLIPFLEIDNLDILPVIVTSCINLFPTSQHAAIMELLCSAIIPFVYSWNDDAESYAIESIPTILQIVFQHVEKQEYHSWLVESFMSKKKHLWKDLMLLIAYGSTESRIPATCSLFYYWPELCPVQFLSCQSRFPAKYHHQSWKAIICERIDCPNKASKTEAKKMSFEPNIAATYGNKNPPLYLCLDCFDCLTRNKITNFQDVILPIKSVKNVCESKTCRSKNNTAFVTCYTSECISLNGNKPIRFCEACHIQKHLGAQSKKHIYQSPVPEIWDCSMEIQPTVVEAIIGLSMETVPISRKLQCERSDDSSGGVGSGQGGGNMEGGGGGGGHLKLNMDGNPSSYTSSSSSSVLGVIKNFSSFQNTDIPLTGKYSDEDQKIISIYSVFLIGERCPIKSSPNIEILGRILSGLFHWFLNTAAKEIFDFSPDEIGDFIEKIKRDYILKWIKQVEYNNLEVVLMVLLPYPVEYAKIGNCWESLCDRSSQVKTGLELIYSLIPYDVITFETWDYVVPFWLETLHTEIPETQYGDLQNLMKKIFDQHAGPFPFLPAKLYNFATQRFTNTHIAVQDQVLSWLQILTTTTVVIPMKELLTMFSIGVKSIHDINKQTETENLDPSHQNQSNIINPSSPASTCTSRNDDNNDLKKSNNDIVTIPNDSASTVNEDDAYELGDTSVSHMSRPETPIDDDLEQYSMLACLCMMMSITNVQLHKNDPIGHGNMSQETPTLTLGLMCEMLQLDWSKERCRHTIGDSQISGNQSNINMTGRKISTAATAANNASNTTSTNINSKTGNQKIDTNQFDTSCSYCQNALLWHTSCNHILKHIVPINAVAIPEGPMTLETLNSTKNEDSADSKTKPTQKPDNLSLDNDKSEQSNSQDPDNKEPISNENDTETKPDEEIEDKGYDISELGVEMKLIYLLVNELELFINDPEITNAILTSLTYLIRHAELFKTDHEKKVVFIDYLLEKKLIALLWDLLSSEYSYLGEITVSLLLHCVTIKKGTEKLWQILQQEFTHEDWRNRFDAVEKVTILARNIDNTMIVNNYTIITSLAHAFCNLIGSLDDLNSAVVTRTQFYLNSIRDKSLACIVKCLEIQFDSVIVDRTLILLRIFQLSWALPGRNVFSWDFFIARFGIFSIEAQIGTNLNVDQGTIIDLSNQKGGTEVFSKQFERARIAISHTTAIRSLTSSDTSKPLFSKMYSCYSNSAINSSIATSSANINIKYNVTNNNTNTSGNTATDSGIETTLFSSAGPNKINMNNTSTTSLASSHMKFHLPTNIEQKSESSDKHRSSTMTPFTLGRRKSKPLLPGLGGVNVAEYTDSNNRFLTNMQETIDSDVSNRDTLHQWVALLLKFMANVDIQISKDESKEKKALSKVQRHLALLLGYSDQAFNIPPYKLRNSTVFHAFLSNISQILDRNFSMGASILHQTLVVLQYCPSPQRYASDSQPSTFSLWLLEPQTRKNWLNTLLVILYKYEYNASGAGSGVSGGYRQIVDYLVRIVINTVENHLHVCKPFSDDDDDVDHDVCSPPSPPHIPRQRDASNVSVEVDLAPDPETPPSPSNNLAGSSNVSFGDSLNLIRNTSGSSHYTKKDKDSETLTTRFTSPVIKKKVARQNLTTRVPNLGGSKNGSLLGAQPNVIMNKQFDDGEDTIGENGVSDAGTNEELEVGKLQHSSSTKSEKITVPINVSIDEKNLKPVSTSLQPVLEEGQETKTERKQPLYMDNKITEQLNQFAATNQNKENTELSVKESLTVEDKEKTDEESDSTEDKPNYRQRKSRKSGLTSVEIQKVLDGKEDPGRRRPRRSELPSNDAANPNLGGPVGNTAAGSSNPFIHRQIESFMVERCKKCSAVLEHYDEETLGLAIVCFGAYVHREPALAAPCLYDMLVVAAKLASYNMYSWKINLPNIIVPGNLMSISRQFLRCTFYNLYPNGLFVQLFQTEIENNESFFKCMVSVLLDFEDHLDLFQPVQQVLEGFNKRKAISTENIMVVIENLAAYFEALPIPNMDDTRFHHLLTSWWMNIINLLEIFFHKLPNLLLPLNTNNNSTNVSAILRMMIVIIRANITTNCKPLMDTFGNLLKYIVENCNFSLPPVLELCSMTNRLYKDKGKSSLTKCLIEELHAAIKFKIYIPDKNLLMLIQFVLMDAGGTIEPNKICEGVTDLFNPATYHILNTGAAELMRNHLHDCITFLSDLNTVHRVKQYQKTASGVQSLHEDTLGSHLKSALAQYLALELSTMSNTSSSRLNYYFYNNSNTNNNTSVYGSPTTTALELKDAPILQYMPWLKFIPPSTQQGPREFTLCVDRVRTLNWLLLGSMIHTTVTRNSTGISCLPIPPINVFNKSIADLIKVILSGFPDQQKQSVVVMSSLYHVFVLCQLWTMYCETAANIQLVGSNHQSNAVQTAVEFWMSILPTILQLLAISDDFVVVNGHILTVMEELLECRSITVTKVIDWLTPILMSRTKQLAGGSGSNLHKRLQKCIESDIPITRTIPLTTCDNDHDNDGDEEDENDDKQQQHQLFIKWLKKHVFVLARNEDQHSAASQMFIQ